MTGYRACQAAATQAAGCPWPSAEFRVLGPFEVTAVGRPVPVSPGERTLLHVLLLFSGQPCPQDLLFAALWGDTWPADPVAALARCAARAARAVDLWVGITAWSGLYQASARADVLDLDRFRRGRAQAAAAAGRGDLAAALHEALGCWRSPVIPGLPAAAEVEPRLSGCSRNGTSPPTTSPACGCGWAGTGGRCLPCVPGPPLSRAASRPPPSSCTRCWRPAVRGLRSPPVAACRLAAELGLGPGPEVRDLLRCVLAGGPLPPLPGTGIPSPPWPARPGPSAPSRPCPARRL